MTIEMNRQAIPYTLPELLIDHFLTFNRETIGKYCSFFPGARISTDGNPEDDIFLFYSWLFEGTSAEFDLPLWESHYRHGEKVLQNTFTLDVTKFYLRYNVLPKTLPEEEPSEDCSYPYYDDPDNDHQPADFIGYESEFYYWLRQRGEKDAAGEFLKEHLAPLCRGIADRLTKELQKTDYKTGPAEYFSALADAIRSALIREEKSISEAPEEENNSHLPCSCTEPDHPYDIPAIVPPSCPDHFILLSAESAAQFLKERTIASSGRGNCGGKCALRAHTAGGCITALDAGVEDAHTKTVRACVRGRAYRETFLSTDRLRYPMVRVGERGSGRFRRITWREALDLMAEKITEISEKYGPGSRYVNYASGVTSPLAGNLLMPRFFSLSGGFLDSFGSYSSACLRYMAPYVFGPDSFTSSMASYHDTNLLILWGNNPVVTLYDDLYLDLLKDLKQRKIPIIIIDPQFSDTAAVFADQWIAIRPGTDGALASAIAWMLWTENLCDQPFMDTYCQGFDREHMPADAAEEETFHDYIFGIRDGIPKTPAWAAEITGISENVIRNLALQYGKAKPAAIMAGLGLQRNANGEQNVKIIMALQCMTGNVGIRGGSAGHGGGIQSHAYPSLPAVSDPYGRSISCFLWTEAILRGHEFTRRKERIRGGETLSSDIKLIFNINGNTLINQHSDANRTARILQDTSKVEFIVVSDIFMTPSAKFADLLLPGTSLFEEDSLATPWGEGHFMLYANRAIHPLFCSRAEYYWIRELAERLGIPNMTEGTVTQRAWNRILYDRVRSEEPELPDFDIFAKEGGWRYLNNPDIIAFEEQIRDPEHHPFRTESGRIEIYSNALKQLNDPERIPPIPKYVPAFEGIGDPRCEKWPLQLIGWHSKRRTHSIHDNNPLLEEVDPQRLWINPEDAGQRNIQDGDLVEIFNDRGIVRIKAHVSARIMKGVICLPQGAWYTPDKTGTDIRGCINTLTTQRPTPLAMANPQHSCLAEVRKAEEIET